MIKWIKRLLFLASIFIIGFVCYLKFALPDIGDPPKLKVEGTLEQVKRGEYLANHVTVCIDCHSKRDWTKFAGPIIPGTEGMGGEAFTKDFGFPGSFFAKNITPFHLKDWTDGEIFRTITTGVNKDNKALFPVMPYHYYAKMDEADIEAIIAYIRTLKPIKNETAVSKADFPMSLIINTIPQKASLTKIPDKKDLEAYGAYMTNASGCHECHTKQEKGKPLPGMDFAGGWEFNLGPMGKVISANITPDRETGIGDWTMDAFISRFKAYNPTSFKPPVLGANDNQTVMPWLMYAGMDSFDLKAIYAYLRSVEPVYNQVDHFPK